MRLRERGYPVLAVISRTRANAEALALKVEARVASDSFRDLPPETRLVVCCVPDDKVTETASRLSRITHDWRKTVVLHTSGALAASALAPLEGEGARTLSFHPLQALTRSSETDVLDGVYAGIEGPSPALAAGIELAVGLGMRYLILSAEDKPRYHLAASIASNFLVTLQAVVQQIFQTLDVDRETAQEVVAPLVRGTLDNLAASTPEEALTGPILRGDLETVHKHGLALRRYVPHLVPVYASLAMETITLAVRSSRLDPRRAEEMVSLLDKMVSLPLPVLQPVREPATEPVTKPVTERSASS
jgi:predicted short-subunit dehydrogenase-like oxidoreductase (DUF2520 family)